jgi:hypothetical protein
MNMEQVKDTNELESPKETVKELLVFSDDTIPDTIRAHGIFVHKGLVHKFSIRNLLEGAEAQIENDGQARVFLHIRAEVLADVTGRIPQTNEVTAQPKEPLEW